MWRVEFAHANTWRQKNEHGKVEIVVEIRVAVAAIGAPRGLDGRSWSSASLGGRNGGPHDDDDDAIV